MLDGQVPQPVAGSVLAAVGVRAYCWAVRQHDAAQPVRALTQAESGRAHAYEVFGTAGPARDFSADSDSWPRHAGAEFVLHAGRLRFLASIEGRASEIAPGAVLAVMCTLDLVAGYERDAFELPDVRTDWHVVSVERLPASDGLERDDLLDLRPVTPWSPRVRTASRPGTVAPRSQVSRGPAAGPGG